MSLFLTKEERVFQDKARNFSADNIAPIADKVEREEYFPRDILAKMGRSQLLGGPFQPSDGGLGLGWSSEILVDEEVSAVSAATEMTSSISHPVCGSGVSLRK